MLAYNVHVGNEVYCIASPSEDKAIEWAIKLYKYEYKYEYNKDVSKEDCRIVWDYIDEE